MAKIMELFATELDEFTANYEKEHWDVTFRGEEYPPRVVMEQTTPPLYKIEEDGNRTIEPVPTIQIIGRPDLQVVTTGKLQISKKRSHKNDKRRGESAGTVPARVYAGAEGNGERCTLNVWLETPAIP